MYIYFWVESYGRLSTEKPSLDKSTVSCVSISPTKGSPSLIGKFLDSFPSQVSALSDNSSGQQTLRYGANGSAAPMLCRINNNLRSPPRLISNVTVNPLAEEHRLLKC